VAVMAVMRARGVLAEAEGDLTAAETALAEAVRVGTECNRPLELGRSLLALGTVQRRLRKKHVARQTLVHASEIFSRLGAVLWEERARRELARIGGRSTPRGELSATERASSSSSCSGGRTRRWPRRSTSARRPSSGTCRGSTRGSECTRGPSSPLRVDRRARKSGGIPGCCETLRVLPSVV